MAEKYKEDRNIFDKNDEPEKTEFPVIVNKKSHKGIVANINKVKGTITVDVNGNGETTPYLEERHSNLKVGDPIEF